MTGLIIPELLLSGRVLPMLLDIDSLSSMYICHFEHGSI